jgi:hypothetical protein
MADVAAILRHKAFWPFYVQMTEDELAGDILRHFDPSPGEDEEYESIDINLPCGADHSLSLTIEPNWFHIGLGLQERGTGKLIEMGWWDQARWHPFAIRWNELLALYEYWQQSLRPSIHPSVAFLLIAPFVGHGADEKKEFTDRQRVILGHYEKLDLYSKSKCQALAKATLILPSEKDYRWTHDNELGWVFGGEYPCYSLRNAAHASGEEGTFPFADWQRVVDGLPDVS